MPIFWHRGGAIMEASNGDSNTQISKIYRVACALDGLAFDQPIPPFEIERITGISRETVLNYFHYALFYQNFWPRVAIIFDKNPSSKEKIKIVKKGFPAAFDLYFAPKENIMLRLLMLGAYSGRYVLKSRLLLNSKMDTWLEELRNLGLINIENNKISLTSKGRDNAFENLDRFAALRGDCFANVQKIADMLAHPVIINHLPIERLSIEFTSYCKLLPHNTMCKVGLIRSGYWNLLSTKKRK